MAPKPVPSFFAAKVIRAMTKSCAAQIIGAAGCFLVTVVAMQWDRKRYCGMVTFYNDQLAPLIGANSRGALVRARQKAVNAGWLVYHAGGKSVPGRYAVAIPESAAHLDDSACDEGDEQFPRPPVDGEMDRQQDLPVHERTEKRTANGRSDGLTRPQMDGQADCKRTANGHLSYLQPDPTPKEEPTSQPNWLVIEADFIAQWNATPGIAPYSRNAMPHNLSDSFREYFQSPGWLDRARAALAKFPLQNGNIFSLKKFLEPTSIDNILGGVYDFRPKETRNENRPYGNGQRYNPAAEPARF